MIIFTNKFCSIVDSSIDEVEEVTEEKTVTVQELPITSSTFELSEQQGSGQRTV